MEFLSNLKRTAYKVIFLILFYSILLWFSLFLYFLTYYLYIPAVAHVRPIYFQYSIAQCLPRRKISNVPCPFPSANISLVTKSENDLLSRGQYYAIEVVLEMPESEKNRKQGMFMVKINMLSEYGEQVQVSSRPALLHYKSTFLKYLYTLFYAPGLLAGTVEEKQELIIPLFEKYEEDRYQSTHYIYIEVQAAEIEIYRAQLRIHAQFTGLRYFMYYWPLSSAVMGVFMNFFFVSCTVLFTWIRYLMVNEQTSESRSLPSQLSKLKTKGKSAIGKKKLPLKSKNVVLDKGEALASSIDDTTSSSSTLKICREGADAVPDSTSKNIDQNDKESQDEIWSDAEPSTSEELPITLRKRRL